MGDGTLEKPLTLEDVLKAIEENGGTAEGLDLSGKVFEEGIDLRKLNLRRITLKGCDLSGAHLKGANLWNAHLEGAILRGAQFERASLSHANLEGADLLSAHLERAHLRYANLKGADLSEANLEGTILTSARLEGAYLLHAHLEKANLQEAYLEDAELWFAHLQDADLSYAHLKRADLWFANLEGVQLSGAIIDNDTNLLDAHWGNYILGEENNYEFGFAINIYRRLKQWHTYSGMYAIAGEFFFREMTVKRKMLKWWPNPIPRAWSKFISLICGYGERPLRVIGLAASVVVGLALIYFIIGSVWELPAFWNSLYFSAVSFTALGYGSWVEISNDWIRGIGALESFIGVLTIALFLVTFVRKMTR